MKIFLIDKTKISKHELPEKIEDSFVISYKPLDGTESFITVEAINGKWNLKSNGSVNIIGESLVLAESILENYQKYVLKFLGLDTPIILYAMPTVEPENYKLDLKGLNNISIGDGPNNNIYYNNKDTCELHSEIKKTNEGWYLTANTDLKYQTFLNFKLLTSPKKLEGVGDVIFINGLKLVWMGDFLQINNPNRTVTVIGLNASMQNHNVNNTDYTVASDEEQSFELYSEDDYFYHVPRIKEIVDEETIEIDPPPASQITEDLPFLLTLGSSLTMAASSLIMGYNVGNGLMSGERTALDLLPQIVMCFSMIVGSLIMPKVVSSYQKRKAQKREAYRLKKYNEYLDIKENEIDILKKNKAQILKDNRPSSDTCPNIILSTGNRNFWSREIIDEDFLKLRLGLGDIESPIKIEAPKERFTLDEDDLLTRVIKIAENNKKLENVPVDFSLIDENITAMICSDANREDYINGIMLQLISLHSASDLKIVILTDESKIDRWDYIRFLPHALNDDKTVRFFATNKEEYKEVSNFLEEEFKSRKSLLENKNKDDSQEVEEIKKSEEYKNFKPYYLIISDNYKSNYGVPIIDNILKYSEVNYGFSFLIFTETMKNLPSKIETFVEIGKKEGCKLEKNISAKSQQTFIPEIAEKVNMREISNKLLNIPLMTKEGLSVLPTSLTFLEMYGLSKIEQLNILNRWKTNNPVVSLNAPIGVYANGEQFKLNLHEKFHGPHGLIAGSTGSGKSEFIITYILSMCVNYHPYEAQFVLIDYKGGGLAGAFENKETGVRIPHLTGTITNLDTAEMNRTLVSIESEMKRRQRIFNETRDSLGESTIDIYKYQRLYREGQVKEPLAHLFIISDEFAELKSQQPEFMAQLISTARIGRSLGVHLILATQKPSGVVNDQIWSNSKFKICLKVQDRSDSMEMLKRPEAASIKETGRFYLQVGFDDFFDKGQSGWAGAKYMPSDRIIKRTDDTIDFINNVGYVTKSVKDIIKIEEDKVNYGDQLTNIVKHLCDLGLREGIKTNKLWLDSIPEKIYIDNIKKKYDYKPEPYYMNPLIGEYDKPIAQEQGVLNLDLSNNGNTLIWGQSGSGKENLLSTIIWSSITEHTPEEISFYVIDCGSEILKIFNNIPHIGGIATAEEENKIINMFIMIEEELQERKDVMTDYGGSYKEYIEHSGEKLPLIVVIINNYEIFTETYGRLSESIQSFYRDGSKYGIVFIISSISTNAVKNRMVQNFTNKICLQIPNETEYRSVVNAPRGLFPSKFFGRGLVTKDGTAYEFQTAMVCEKKELSNNVRKAAELFNNAYHSRAKRIPMVPDIVKFDNVKEAFMGLTSVPVGIEFEAKTISTFDFTEKLFSQILTKEIDKHTTAFYNVLINEISSIKDVTVNVIDFLSCYDNKNENINYFNEKFDETIIELNNYILSNRNNQDKKFVNVFLGIGKIRELLSTDGLAVLNNLFSNSASLKNTNHILIDDYISYRNVQLEEWYQSNVDKSNGIWLGEGIENQLSINVNNLSIDERKMNYFCMAFVVNKGKHVMIRYIVDESVEV